MKRVIQNNLLLISIAVLCLLAIHLPTLLGYLVKNQGLVFTGQVSWFNPWDINVYVSAITQAQSGLNPQNLYTSAPHTTVDFYPLYTAIGHIFPKTDPYLLFNLASAVANTLLIILIYVSAKKILKSKTLAIMATPITLFGGGLGAFFLLTKESLAVDLTTTPTTFTNTWQAPHTAVAIGLYIYSLSSVLTLNKNEAIKAVFPYTCALIISTFFYPYLLLHHFIVSARTKAVAKLAILYAITVPLTSVRSAQLVSSSTYGEVLAGGTLITPSPKELLAGIGVFIFPIIYLFLVKIKDKNHSAALWWLVVSIGLSYSPLPFARMYLRDIFFPLALLFTIFLSQLNQANTRHRILAVFLILLSVASSVYIFSIRAANSFVPIKLLSQSYITKDQKDALDFLKRKTEANSTVLSLMPTANIIPPKTANKVPAGHTYNTVGFKTKYSQIESFYKGDLPIPAMSNFLQKHKITYIYLGEEEAKLAPAKALETFNSNFTQIYSNRTIKIYRYTTTTPPNAN